MTRQQLRNRDRARYSVVVLAVLIGACGSAGETAAEGLASSLTTSTTMANSTSTSSSTTSTSSSTTSTTAAPTSSSTSTTRELEETTTPVTTAQLEAESSTTTSSNTTSSAVGESSSTTSSSTIAQPPPETVANDQRFSAEVFEVTGLLADRFVHSWREGCPVGLDELVLVSLNHWNFDGQVVVGELVIHEDHAGDIIDVFSRLFDGEFPIERMEIVDNFQGSDDLSMAANNTSGFNCREVAGRPGRWSNHAFGTAIDINPLQNPLVSDTVILPPEGADYVDRSVRVQGGIYPGDLVTQAFAEIGWGWGGDWNSLKDWQHFSASGN